MESKLKKTVNFFEKHKTVLPEFLKTKEKWKKCVESTNTSDLLRSFYSQFDKAIEKEDDEVNPQVDPQITYKILKRFFQSVVKKFPWLGDKVHYYIHLKKFRGKKTPPFVCDKERTLYSSYSPPA